MKEGITLPIQTTHRSFQLIQKPKNELKAMKHICSDISELKIQKRDHLKDTFLEHCLIKTIDPMNRYLKQCCDFYAQDIQQETKISHTSGKDLSFSSGIPCQAEDELFADIPLQSHQFQKSTTAAASYPLSPRKRNSCRTRSSSRTIALKKNRRSLSLSLQKSLMHNTTTTVTNSDVRILHLRIHAYLMLNRDKASLHEDIALAQQVCFSLLNDIKRISSMLEKVGTSYLPQTDILNTFYQR